MNRKTAIIFYVLSAYVLVQFIWWGYHILELTSALKDQSDDVSKRMTMILGEGAVFLFLLLLGILYIRRSILHELKLSQRQKNFLLSVTHELKTPLAANKLYLQTIIKRDLESEQRNDLLYKAIEENARLERMIDNILNASRLENQVLELTEETFDLNLLIEQLAERFRSFNHTGEILVETPAEITLKGDRFMIETILTNLLENAQKYAGKKSQITIYASSNADTITIGVHDNGPGVEEQYRTEIFKKFFRIGSEQTRTSKGSGLGLFIVDQLVKIHGGQIQCLKSDDGGADFRITMKK